MFERDEAAEEAGPKCGACNAPGIWEVWGQRICPPCFGQYTRDGVLLSIPEGDEFVEEAKRQSAEWVLKQVAKQIAIRTKAAGVKR